MAGKGRIAALLAALALITAACGSNKPTTQQTTAQGGLQKGGVLKLGLTSDVHEAMDPGREYYTIGWEFLRCCLARTLLGYNAHDAEHGGTQVIPDVATALPTASSDGLTWTFTIKPNIHYAPPLASVSVTAGDFVRAINRLAAPATTASYPFYYSDITGFSDANSGKAKTVSGVSAPNDSTFVVHLDRQVGYFPFLFTLPATAPIPPSPTDPSAPLGVATGHNTDYGQFIASTGPYMFKGADTIDYSAPAASQKGPEGFQAGKSYVLVRNPSWSAATDSVRKAYVNEIDVTVGGTVPDVQNKVESGALDVMDALPNPEGIRAYVTDPSLKPYLHALPFDGTYYINMNMAMAPFDDLAVRKAMNYVVDKAGLLRLSGGSVIGSIATHIVPDSLLPSLKGYDPYGSPGDSGSVTQAKAAMMQSKYDTNHDGMCDATACKNVLMVIDQTDPQPKLAALIQQNMAQIGITVTIKQFQTTTMYTKCEDAKQQIAMCPSEGWFRDFPDPYAFVTGLFSSASLTPSCCDDALVGATSKQLSDWGYANTTPTPSIDSQLNQCVPTQGDARQTCYANVDKYLMENVVPWVPYRFANETVITSKRVLNYNLDDFAGWIALDQVALANGGA